MKIINKLVTEKKLEPAKIYSSFALQEVPQINKAVERWIKGTSFANSTVPFQITSVEIDGSSEGNIVREDDADNIKYTLIFGEQFEKNNTPIGDNIIHVKRTPAVMQYGHGPNFFNSQNYFQIRVTHGDKRGWVKNGELPKGPIMVTKRMEEENHDDDALPNFEQVPAFGDIEREILVGFEAAKEYSKYRAMVLSTQDFFLNNLRNVRNAMPSEQEFGRKRYIGSFAALLWLELLPDTIQHGSITALKSYFLPGVIESEFVLGIENGKSHTDEQNINNPFSYMKGQPIRVFSSGGKDGSYDARILVRMHCTFSAEEKTSQIIERNLSKYFDITAVNGKTYDLILEIPNANKIHAAILEGKKDTKFHNDISNIVNAFTEVKKSADRWNDAKNAIDAGYTPMIDSSREAYFKKLENNLRFKVR